MSLKKPDFHPFFFNSEDILEHAAGAKYMESFNYWYFRYDDIVYKVFKKPVRSENIAIESHFLNKMQINAQTLSPDLNFEVWALEKAPADELGYKLVPFEDSEDNVVHFVFKMKFLPANKLMSYILEKNKLDMKGLKVVCEHLYEFHKRTGFISDNYTGTYDHLLKIFDDLVFQSKKYLHRTFSEAVINMTVAPIQRFLNEHKRLLFSRMKNGKIREIHRCCIPSKIFIDKTDAFFIPMYNDSISHNYADVACDLADLSLALVMTDQKELADKLVAYYCQLSGDNDLKEVLPLYMVLKAYQSGLYESRKLSAARENNADEDMILNRATGYYDKSAILATDLSRLVTTKIRNKPRSV